MKFDGLCLMRKEVSKIDACKVRHELRTTAAAGAAFMARPRAAYNEFRSFTSMSLALKVQRTPPSG